MLRDMETQKQSWQDFIKPHEAERLAELKQQHRATVAERVRIYDRCRKRARKASKANPVFHGRNV